MESKMIARMLGLEESVSEKQIEEKALTLSGFAADVLAATGAKDTAAALGKIRAGAEAVGARAALEAQLKAKGEEATQSEYRHVLKDAFKEGRLSLGDAAKILPFLKDEEAEKAKAALGAVKEQSRKEIVGALCAAHVSEKRLKSIKAYIELNPPKGKTPEAKAEPALTEDNAQKVTMVTSDQVQKFASMAGIPAERAAVMLQVRSDSVDDYMKAMQPKK